MREVPDLYDQQEKNMDSPDNARGEVSFAQLIFNSDILGRETPEDEQRKRVDIAAARFATVFEEIASQAVLTNGGERIKSKVHVQVFRSRGVRGEGDEASLPSGSFWGLQLFLRPI